MKRKEFVLIYIIICLFILCLYEYFFINKYKSQLNTYFSNSNYYIVNEGTLSDYTNQANYDIANKIIYTTNSCIALSKPDNTSSLSFHCTPGTSLTIKGQYRDWYYVKKNNSISNHNDFGWIQKNYLGTYKHFVSPINLEVNLKKGSPVQFTNSNNTQVIEEESNWGRIYDETKDTYYLILQDNIKVIVNKDYITF